MFVCIENSKEARVKFNKTISRLLDVKSIYENELHSNNHQHIENLIIKIPFTKQQMHCW